MSNQHHWRQHVPNKRQEKTESKEYVRPTAIVIVHCTIAPHNKRGRYKHIV